jgi:hypothetical protein
MPPAMPYMAARKIWAIQSAMFNLTLLRLSDKIQLYSKQHMLSNLHLLLIRVNHQNKESVG